MTHCGLRGDHMSPGWAEGTGRRVQLTLPAAPQAVRLARRATRDALGVWQLGQLEETAVLLVSELVTNAVRHAMCTDAITLELRVVQTRLRIEAYRCRPGLVVPRTTGQFDEPGFGCALLDALADKWGVRETVTGTTAWAELDVEPGPKAR